MNEELEQAESKEADTKENSSKETEAVALEADPYVIMDVPKAKLQFPVWARVVVITVAVILVIYGAGVIYFQDHFLWNSNLNGMDVSMKSVMQTQSMIESVVDNYELEIRERGGATERISGADIDLDYQLLSTVSEVVHRQNPFLWFLQGFPKKDYRLEVKVTYDLDKLHQQIRALECMQRENVTVPVEPQIVRKNGTFMVQEGEEGNQLQALSVRKEIQQAIDSFVTVVDLEQAGCYSELKYISDAKEIKACINYLTALQESEVVYQCGESKVVLSGDELLDWVTISEDYEVEIDKAEISAYIQQILDTYDMRGQAVSFRTTSGATVDITSYVSNEVLDVTEETEELSELLTDIQVLGKKRIMREFNVRNVIGDTYIEINLTAQHLYCYKDGQMVLETDVVTGRPSTGCATPPGIYSIRYKSSPAILVGETYRTPVSYWMPFNGGIGLHDATWQSSFGGNRYLSNGSHGCINLPLNMAKQIYGLYEAGDIVVLYHLEGTESVGTEATTTAASVTEPPTTEAPSTEPPSTEPTTTEEPSTEPTTEEQPTTEEPTSEEPTTEPPSV